MLIHRVVYTVEVEITFTDDEMQSIEDLRGFMDYCTKDGSKSSWIQDSVREGNFNIVGTKIDWREE